jgi:hypothetical protein
MVIFSVALHFLPRCRYNTAMGLGDFIYNFKWAVSGLFEKPRELVKEWWSMKAVRVGVLLFAALAVAVPLITVGAVITFKNAQNSRQTAPEWTADPIADEDIFLPAEPDFLPPVLFEQEQKKIWTEDDAGQFWTNPADYPQDFWKARVRDSIDRIMENVP